MTSKAEYLKRYLSGSTDDKPKKKKKREQSVRNVHVMDAEADLGSLAPAAEQIEDAWGRSFVEDQPVMVAEAAETAAAKTMTGMWESVTDAPRGRRHDSDDDSPPRRPRAAESVTDAPRGRRHDSDDDSPPRRPRAAESVTDAPRGSRGRRHDSDGDSPPRRLRAAESVADAPRGRRHDSDGDSPLRTADSGRDGPTRQKVAKTASGHTAGVQSSTEFAKREAELRREREEEMKRAAANKLSGAEADTVYRDKKGKKLDMLNEFMRQQAVRDGKEVKMQKAQFEWGLGTVQRQEAEAARKEIEDMAAAPFARTDEDPELERHRKAILRDGDPMAEYFLQKQSEQEEVVVEQLQKRGVSVKPKYTGPTPAPNRFGIRPGYRWDAVDRGNQFERQVLQYSSNKQASVEDEHRWRSSDL